MERKFKIISIYLSLLFFAAILLILITSFSNSKIDPSYEVEDNDNQYQVNFNKTMEQSVKSLTETNRVLNDKVIDLQNQIEEKKKIIDEYEKKYNEDVVNLQNAMKSFMNDNYEESSSFIQIINRDNLSEEDKIVYDNIFNKLNEKN